MIMILLAGNSKSEFNKALRTLSLLSFTSAEASPTIDMDGRPLDKCTSTVTKGACIPKHARLFMTESDIANTIFNDKISYLVWVFS